MKRLLCLVAVIGCRSDTEEIHVITVTDEVAESFSSDAPGILRVEGIDRAVEILCGQTFSAAPAITRFYGEACLDDDLKGTDVDRTAWIEPIPADWDADAFCGLDVDSYGDGVEIPASIRGDDYETPVAPEAEWVQETVEARWRRDWTRCGGYLRLRYRLE